MPAPAILCAQLILSASAVADEPSATDLLMRAAQVEQTQASLRAQYAFHQHSETRVLDDKGKPGAVVLTEDYDIVYLAGAPYAVLKQRNGKALSQSEGAKIQEEMRRAFRARRTYSTGGPMSLKIGPGKAQFGSLADLARLMNNTLVREETIGGRPAYVVRSAAPPNALSGDARDAEIMSHGHTLWIDREDGAIVRHEIQTAGPYGIIQVFERNEAGVWLMREIQGRSPGTYYFRKRDYLSTTRYSDYRKFDATTTITFDDAPAK